MRWYFSGFLYIKRSMTTNSCYVSFLKGFQNYQALQLFPSFNHNAPVVTALLSSRHYSSNYCKIPFYALKLVCVRRPMWYVAKFNLQIFLPTFHTRGDYSSYESWLLLFPAMCFIATFFFMLTHQSHWNANLGELYRLDAQEPLQSRACHDLIWESVATSRPARPTKSNK